MGSVKDTGNMASPVLLSPGPSARTLAASWEGSTFILKGLMGISCLEVRALFRASHQQETESRAVVCGLTWSANSTMMV